MLTKHPEEDFLDAVYRWLEGKAQQRGQEERQYNMRYRIRHLKKRQI